MTFILPEFSNYLTLSCTVFEGFHHQTVHDDASVTNCLLSLMVIFSIVEITILVLFALNSWLPWYLRQTFWWDDDGDNDEMDREEEAERKRRIEESLHEHTWENCGDDSKCQDCSICLYNFETNDIVVSGIVHPCGHTFHKRCLHLWLSEHSTCPCCRQEMLVSPQLATKEDPLMEADINDDTRISIVPWMTETGELPMSFRDYCLFFF